MKKLFKALSIVIIVTLFTQVGFSIDLLNLDEKTVVKLPTMTVKEIKSRLANGRDRELMKKTFQKNIKRPFGFPGSKITIKDYCWSWEDLEKKVIIEPVVFAGLFMIHPTDKTKDFYVPTFMVNGNRITISENKEKFIKIQKTLYEEGKISKEQLVEYESMYGVLTMYAFHWSMEEKYNKPLLPNGDSYIGTKHSDRTLGFVDLSGFGSSKDVLYGYNNTMKVIYSLLRYDIVRGKAFVCVDGYKKVKLMNEWERQMKSPMKSIKKAFKKRKFPEGITLKEYVDYITDYRAFVFNEYIKHRILYLNDLYEKQ